MKKLKIGFTYDAKADYKLLPGDLPDKYAEFDFEETLSQIENALKSSGHNVERIGNASALLQKIAQGKRWDLVFNIAEGLRGRNRESQVPTILELFGIPYSGSDALTMGITLDKAVAKIMVSHAGVLTPEFLEIEKLPQLAENEKNFKLKYPVLIKPSEEGTSKGISPESACRNFDEVEKITQHIIYEYNQPAIIEEFIAGSEFTVAVIENDPPFVLPPVQIAIKGNTDLGEDFYTHQRVENDDVKYICPAEISRILEKKLKNVALSSYKALGIKDVGRIDIRVDEKGTPYFLECNPLPNLGTIDVFLPIAKAVGLTYDQLILRILHSALERNNLIRKNDNSD